MLDDKLERIKNILEKLDAKWRIRSKSSHLQPSYVHQREFEATQLNCTIRVIKWNQFLFVLYLTFLYFKF